MRDCPPISVFLFVNIFCCEFLGKNLIEFYDIISLIIAAVKFTKESQAMKTGKSGKKFVIILINTLNEIFF